MPTVRIWPGGSSGGFAGYGSAEALAARDRRGDVRGWTAGSARRLVAFLWSVDATKLEGRSGWAVTLTMGGTPESAAQWHGARRAFQERMRRQGVELQQWIVEWTRKGRPHLHMALYGPGRLEVTALIAWLAICDKRGWPVSARAQHIVPITGTVGWLQYLAKHAARGIDHYQRQGAPPGWEKTGRLWGHLGEWPVTPPLEVELEPHQFWAYRRLCVGYQKARMRAAGVSPRIWRKLGHRNGDREQGAYMGVSGWIPEAVASMLLSIALDAQPTIHYHDWE